VPFFDVKWGKMCGQRIQHRPNITKQFKQEDKNDFVLDYIANRSKTKKKTKIQK